MIKDGDQVVSSLFGWCQTNDHSNCKRIYRRFLVNPKTNKVDYLDEVVQCACTKRGCKCYIKPADRPKAAKKTRRKT